MKDVYSFRQLTIALSENLVRSESQLKNIIKLGCIDGPRTNLQDTGTVKLNNSSHLSYLCSPGLHHKLGFGICSGDLHSEIGTC